MRQELHILYTLNEAGEYLYEDTDGNLWSDSELTAYTAKTILGIKEMQIERKVKKAQPARRALLASERAKYSK